MNAKIVQPKRDASEIAQVPLASCLAIVPYMQRAAMEGTTFYCAMNSLKAEPWWDTFLLSVMEANKRVKRRDQIQLFVSFELLS